MKGLLYWLIGLGILSSLAVGGLISSPLSLFGIWGMIAAILVWRFVSDNQALNPVEPLAKPKTNRETEGLYGLPLERLPLPAVIVDSGLTILSANQLARRYRSGLRANQPLHVEFRSPQFLDELRGLARANPVDAESGESRSAKIIRLPERQLDILANPVSKNKSARANREILIVFLDRSREMALEETRITFVANASHELRTPLASISSILETLQGTALQDPEGQKRMITLMKAQAERMTRLVEDLLHLSRLETRAAQTAKESVDLTLLCRQAEHTFAPIFADHSVALTFDLDEGPIYVTGHPQDLASLIHNLLDNALKYGENQPVSLSLKKVRTKEKDRALLVVQDQGPGVDEEHLGRLTERFYRVNADQRLAANGTGLGLSLVKHIAANHEAEVTIISPEGSGLRVEIDLPCS